GTRPERTNVFVGAAFEPLRLGLTTAISGAADMDVVGGAAGFTEMFAAADYRRADVLVVDAAAVNARASGVIEDHRADWPLLRILFPAFVDAAGRIAPVVVAA